MWSAVQPSPRDNTTPEQTHELFYGASTRASFDTSQTYSLDDYEDACPRGGAYVYPMYIGV